jgi:NADH:ubiquinone oxidoreductase subunit 6 (subunit J)
MVAVCVLCLLNLIAAAVMVWARRPLHVALAWGVDLLSLTILAWLLSGPLAGVTLAAVGLGSGLLALERRGLPASPATTAPPHRWAAPAGGATFFLLWMVTLWRIWGGANLPTGAPEAASATARSADLLAELLSRYGLGAVGVALMALAACLGHRKGEK